MILFIILYHLYHFYNFWKNKSQETRFDQKKNAHNKKGNQNILQKNHHEKNTISKTKVINDK